MKYIMDFLFGLLGFFVGWFVYELAKSWLARRREALMEVRKKLLRDLERPPAPARQAMQSGKRYSVAEILAAARKEQRRQGP